MEAKMKTDLALRAAQTERQAKGGRTTETKLFMSAKAAVSRFLFVGVFVAGLGQVAGVDAGSGLGTVSSPMAVS